MTNINPKLPPGTMFSAADTSRLRGNEQEVVARTFIISPFDRTTFIPFFSEVNNPDESDTELYKNDLREKLQPIDTATAIAAVNKNGVLPRIDIYPSLMSELDLPTWPPPVGTTVEIGDPLDHETEIIVWTRVNAENGTAVWQYRDDVSRTVADERLLTALFVLLRPTRELKHRLPIYIFTPSGNLINQARENAS